MCDYKCNLQIKMIYIILVNKSLGKHFLNFASESHAFILTGKAFHRFVPQTLKHLAVLDFL